MKKCVIVDDSPFDRKILTYSMERLGMECIDVATQEETLELCKRELPDCILLDWEMPELGGVDILKQIRAMSDGDSIAIIICTSNNEPRDLCHAHRDGATDFVFKPVTINRLHSKFQAIGLIPKLEAVS